MITVTLLTTEQTPWAAGVPVQLLSSEGKVISKAQTNEKGLAIFDIAISNVGQVALRLDMQSWQERDPPG